MIDKPKPVPTPTEILEALRLGENETASTIGKGGHRVWLYPRETKGRFTQWRTVVALVLMVVYLGFPWLRWQGEALFRIDVFDRKMVLLGYDFFPQDIRLFLPGVIGFVLVVFLVTATWGRVWCGWACPQTVFLQFLFGPIEKWIEGRAAVRQKRDSAPISFDWLWRKVAKHAVFAVAAILISNTALAYFWGTDGVIYAMTHSPVENWTAFSFVAAFAAVFYWVFAYFREQACVIVCPYARFQSVLIDEKSTVVAYDAKRGEKRGRGAKREGLGDCVDCKQCVLVCPTGIDIRQGNQLECIGCTRCMDACDQTMTAVKKTTGLIRYASLLELQGKSTKGKHIRPIIYGVLATLLFSICGYLVLTRPLLAGDVLRRGNAPYQQVGADSILNTYTLHIRNKDRVRQIVSVRFADATPGTLNWSSRSFTLGRGEIKTLPLDIVVPRSAFHLGKREIKLEFVGVETSRVVKTTLVGPYGN